MISLRPSSTFTVLAISNVEMWRCLWLKLDSTARAAETLVFRRGYGGTQRFILLYTMWVLLYRYNINIDMCVINSYEIHTSICPNGNG